jgi:hypothetical protein
MGWQVTRTRPSPGTDHRLAAQLALSRRPEPRPSPAPPRRPLSITEQLALAPSPFALEMILRDAALFAPRADAKTRDRWAHTAHARDCELRGVLP